MTIRASKVIKIPPPNERELSYQRAAARRRQNAARLKHVRENLNYTQKEMAALLTEVAGEEVTGYNIFRWENSKTNMPEGIGDALEEWLTHR